MKTKLLLLGASLVTVIFVFSAVKGSIAIFGSGSELEQAQVSVKQLQAENHDLHQKLNEAQSPDYVAKVAHDQLNMVLPGETVIVLPHEATSEAHLVQPLQDKSNWQRWWSLFFE